jgi:hypothetical protein
VHTTRDATERRITELYTKAADLLDSGQAPVRLAGLYAWSAWRTAPSSTAKPSWM